MARVPDMDPVRDRQLARLRKALLELQRIPPHRRECELADVRVKDVKAMIAQLEKGLKH